jgi:hypothetical protein
MSIIKYLRRFGIVLAGLGFALAGFAVAAPASMAMIPVPAGGDANGGGISDPAPIVRTVVVGGMPGWQIALIAVVAALVAATSAVLLERGRSARRGLVTRPT